MRRCPLLHALLILLGLAAMVGGSGIALAQTPLHLVDKQTQVRSISFRFVDGQTFESSLLEEQIALTEQPSLFGSVALRRSLSFIPLVAEVGVHPFQPIEMQKDVVRMERFYNRNGFLHPEIDWLVRLDSARNTVNILYTILEGPPLLLDSLGFRGPDGEAAIELFPPSLREDWRAFRARAALQRGIRLDDFGLLQLQDQTLGWVRDQGYAFAEVAAESVVDSLRNRARVTILVDPGPRGRVSEIQVEGIESVSEGVVLRELPFRVGDRFSRSALIEGQRELFGLNLFQIALIDVVPDQPEDSTVVVQIRVREGDPRIVTARGGYFTEAGLTSEAQWTHRNFFGGARTFTASGVAQTGIGSFAQAPEVVYRVSASLRQPYFLNRRLSFQVTPFAEFRDDVRDKSTAFGGDVTFLYELEQLKTASLQYGFETRDIQDYRFGTTDTTEVSLIALLQANATGLGRLNRNTLGLTATYGEVDDALDPRRGFILRPSAEVAGPPIASSVEYGRLGLTATAYYPLSRSIGLYARITGGRLLPFGKSLPGAGDSFAGLLRLRDALFFGGGTGDVRGWGNALLGPKVLDLVIAEEEDDDGVLQTVFYADRYFPIGNSTKLSGTLEARLPFPGLGPSWGTHVFADAGRVWTPSARFDLPESFILGTTYSDPEQFFYAVGGGFSVGTPVGALRFSVGYKLNASFFDMRSPSDIAAKVQEVFDANPEATDEDFEAAIRTVEPDDFPILGLFSIPNSNRIHLHLSIGQTF